MRALPATWFDVLEPRLRRADPTVGELAEIQVVTDSAVAQRKDQWNEMDSTTGLALLDDGQVRLAFTQSIVVEQGTPGNGHLTAIDRRGGAFAVARVTWAGFDDPHLPIIDVLVRVHPKLTGAAQEVARWELHLYARSDRIDPNTGGVQIYLAPIADPVQVQETGSIEHDITFDFTARSTLPRPKLFTLATAASPVTYLEVRPLKADGTTAGNCAWIRTDTVSEVNSGGNLLTGVTLNESAILGESGLNSLNQTPLNQVPLVRIRTGTVSQAVIAFTTNPRTLASPAAATDLLELVGRAIVPPGTSVTKEVETSHGSGTYVTFLDGQTAADVGGLGATARTEYRLKMTLTPNGSGSVGPIAIELGVRVRTLVALGRTVSPAEGTFASVDPVELRAEVGRISVTIERDGERDYQDVGTRLFSDHYVGAMLLRLWIGAPDLPRSDWLHLDDFKVVDYDPTPSQIVVHAVSLLDELKRIVPRATDVGGGLIERGTKQYQAATLQSVYNDLRDVQIGLPEAWRGPGVTDTDANHVVTAVLMGITPEDRLQRAALLKTPGVDGKGEVDAIAFLAGGANITSQGKIRFADFHGEKSVVQVFRSTEIRALRTPPGLSQRVPEYFVPYGWDDGNRQYRAELRSLHAEALTNLGSVGAGAPQHLPDRIARWIPETPATGSPPVGILAGLIGQRQTSKLGTGLRLWPFATIASYPELEPGDLVALETDQFVARDPNVARAIRGNATVLGVIAACYAPIGKVFAVWVRDYADIIPTATNVTRAFPVPSQPTAYLRDTTGLGVKLVLLQSEYAGDTIKYVVLDAGDPVPAPDDAAWLTYSAAFLVNQLVSADQVLAAYAENGALRSSVMTLRIDRVDLPEVDLLLLQPTATSVELRVSADDEVAAYHVYRNFASVLWPTVNATVVSITRSGATATVTLPVSHKLVTGDTVRIIGANENEYNDTHTITRLNDFQFTYAVAGSPATPATGTIVYNSYQTPLDPTWKMGELSTDPDGGGRDAAGAPLPGGSVWADPQVYGGGDALTVVVVPIDRRGRVGPRAWTRLNITGSALSITVTKLIRSRDGSGCTAGTKAQHTIGWSTVGASDGAHDLRISRAADVLGPWVVVTTITDPVTTTELVDTVDYYDDQGGANKHCQYLLELLDGSAVRVGLVTAAIAYRAVECL